jgi:RNA polymerase sigma-70 factor (ECF subfamily)
VTGVLRSDAELLATLRDQPDVIGVLYDRHADAVHRFLVRRVGLDAAEDLLSEVFTAALGARKRVFPHENGSALPWLYGIARNVLRAHLRQAARVGRRQPETGMDWEAVDARLDAQALGVQLRQVISVLSAKEREVLLLVAWEGLTVTEAAETLGMSKVTARTRLHRARQRAQAVLASIGESPSLDMVDSHSQGELT